MDKSLVFAERYRSNPAPLEQALLGGQNSVTDPYTALNALQKIKQAGQMQTAQMAQQAPAANAQPSIKDSTVAAVNQNRMTAPGVDSDLQNYFGTGGIVAFAMGGVPVKGYKGDEGSVTSSSDDEDDDNYEAADDQYNTDEGDPNAAQAGIAALQGIKPIPTLTGADRQKAIKNLAGSFSFGPDIYNPAIGRLDKAEAESLKAKDQGLGLSLLKASAAMSQGNNLGRAIANAGGAFGESYGEVLKQQQAEQEHRDLMRFHLADAQRKDAMGQYTLAADSLHKSAMEANASQTAQAKRIEMQARLQALANRGGKAGAQISPTNLLYNAQTAYNANPTKENLANLQAAQKAIAATKTTFGTMLSGYVGGEQPKGDIESQKATTQSRAQEDAAVKNAGKEFKDYQEGLVLDTNMRKLQRTNPDAYNKKIEAKKKEIYETNGVGHRLPGASSGATPALPSGYNLDQ